MVVLPHLGNRYSRRFANHRELVAFAREQAWNLDFITPPRRLGPCDCVRRPNRLKNTVIRMVHEAADVVYSR